MDLSGADLFALLLMLRAGTSDSLVVVEGASDSRTLTPHVDASKARLVVGYGKDSVIEAMTLVESSKLPRVVGIIDADLENFQNTGRLITPGNLIFSENYDMESDVFFVSGLAERVIYSQADRNNVNSHLNALAGVSAVDLVVRLAMWIGELRLRSVTDGLGLNLRELPLGNFLNKSTATFDSRRLCPAIRQKSKHTTMTVEQISDLLDRSATGNWTDRRVCCGHDLLHILSGALTAWWGAKVSYEMLCGCFRAALSDSDLRSMKIYQDVQAWSVQNGTIIWKSRI